MRNFVFGYGSLICPTSRSRTVQQASAGQQNDVTAIPVWVAGLQRCWSCRTPYRMTALGVVTCSNNSSESSRVAGVLVPVTEAQLAQFDAREGDEYDRVLVGLDRVETVPFLQPFDEHYFYDKDPHHKIFLDAKQQRQGKKNDAASSRDNGTAVQIWVYQQNNPELPNTDYPIVQSYVDTILRGCLEIHEQFAVEFLRNTEGWGDEEGEIHYVNDRHDHVYIHGDPEWSIAQADLLDGLIQKHRPKHYKYRKTLKSGS